ncbi:MAG: hypothetical protein EOM34_05200 [Clostridia bacterium]|nr:hypothetical protein [Lachnospiraceae bacterium]NCC00063.1 hypothetical protein [Clostridia bacterium]NCD01907.1 hypothetical protein [Clostridia bacterium]
MIQIKDIMPISFLKKEPFTGSYLGMRYRIEKTEVPVAEDSEEKKTILEVCIWPQPFCYDKTPEENKTRNQFEFTPEGLSSSVDWLNLMYSEKKEGWTRN